MLVHQLPHPVIVISGFFFFCNFINKTKEVIQTLILDSSSFETCLMSRHEWVMLVPDIQPDQSHQHSSAATDSEVKHKEVQRVNLGSYFLTSSRRRSFSLRAWVSAACTSQSCDSSGCICNNRINGLVSYRPCGLIRDSESTTIT